MNHKVLGAAFVAFLLAVVFGCGGGGGGGNVGPTTTTTTTGTVKVTISPSKITLPPGGSTTFTASVSDGTGVNFTKSAGTLVVNGLTATYTAPAVAGQDTVTATSTEQPTVAATAIITVSSVSGTTATISGTVDDQNGAIAGVTVLFYNSAGTEVATATTNAHGAFTATVPTSAKSFNLEASTINTVNDYSEFEFNNNWYSSTIVGCNAPLPTLTGGESLTLSDIFLYSTANPPPPPPNCG